MFNIFISDLFEGKFADDMKLGGHVSLLESSAERSGQSIDDLRPMHEIQYGQALGAALGSLPHATIQAQERVADELLGGEGTGGVDMVSKVSSKLNSSMSL